MELLEAIRKRVSARDFLDRSIPDAIINEMLDAARLVPTAGNGQSHMFGVVTDNKLITELARAAGEQMWIASAPLVFACCADISWNIADQPEDDFGLIINNLRFGKEFIEYMRRFPDRKAVMKLFDNGTPCLGAEHIFLTAVSYGLSACFVGWLDTEKAGEILKLPDNIVCLFLLPVGYPRGDLQPREKKSIEEISFMNTWPERKQASYNPCRLMEK